MRMFIRMTAPTHQRLCVFDVGAVAAILEVHRVSSHDVAWRRPQWRLACSHTLGIQLRTFLIRLFLCPLLGGIILIETCVQTYVRTLV